MNDPQTTQRREPYRSVVATSVPAKAFGPMAAAFLAGGIGCLVLGILTTAAAASASFAKTLTISSSVGPLSGKTIWAVAAFVVAWAVLSVALWRRNPSQNLVYGLTGIAIGLGVLMTFPPFYDLFKP